MALLALGLEGFHECLKKHPFVSRMLIDNQQTLSSLRQNIGVMHLPQPRAAQVLESDREGSLTCVILGGFRLLGTAR